MRCFLILVLLGLLAAGINGEKACNVFGDPHVITFDGLKYKFENECTYVLAMDCVDMGWIIYGGFQTCGRGTCLHDISVFHTNQGFRDAVFIGRGWVINHQGTKVPFRQGQDFQIGNIGFSFDGLYLTVSLDGSGVTLTYDGFMGLQISIDETVQSGQTCGLCGNNDGDAENEGTQLRDIGNDVEGSLLGGIEEMVFRWKVDRGEYCDHPVNKEYSRLLPCGNNYRLNDEARASCQELVDNQELFKCHETLNLNTFYEACLADYCNIELLTNEYPVACATASAYSKQCQILGANIRDEIWRSEMSSNCPAIGVTQQAIMAIGVEQPGDGPVSA
ncbi:BMP-binding endothelial regulator protein-like [Bolinopsis microptera]|uniref:BMP-binding endothelial regulator protein-like n=1 Tax=Bolinopsis microptera TaxID=2820187 RepID=UPI00307910CF